MAEFTDADIQGIRWRLSLDGTQLEPSAATGDYIKELAGRFVNAVEDDRTYTDNLLTGCTWYVYDTRVNALAHNKVTGLKETRQWTFAYTGSVLTTKTCVRLP
jgi:hypothetical protein